MLRTPGDPAVEQDDDDKDEGRHSCVLCGISRVMTRGADRLLSMHESFVGNCAIVAIVIVSCVRLFGE